MFIVLLLLLCLQEYRSKGWLMVYMHNVLDTNNETFCSEYPILLVLYPMAGFV